MLICGDFNMPDVDWGLLIAKAQDSSALNDHFMQLDLQQNVSSSTHVRGNILDLIFTNIINFTLAYHSVDFADHLGVLFDFNAYNKEINHSKAILLVDVSRLLVLPNFRLCFLLPFFQLLLLKLTLTTLTVAQLLLSSIR